MKQKNKDTIEIRIIANKLFSNNMSIPERKQLKMNLRVFLIERYDLEINEMTIYH